MRYRARNTSLVESETNIPVVFSSLHLHCISSVGHFIFKTIGSVCVCESKCALQACVCVCVYVCVCVCVGVPSASRNAWVPPKLRWLPSAKMAARIPQSDSTREKEKQRQNECERNWAEKDAKMDSRSPQNEGSVAGKGNSIPVCFSPLLSDPEWWGDSVCLFLFSWFWQRTDRVNSAVCWHVVH